MKPTRIVMATEPEPTVLIVVDNRITSGRLKSVMENKGFKTLVCEDGDKAVDEYVKLRPDIIFIGLDLPTLDGHIAALEIRESDRKARIVFVSSRTRRNKAEDAAYSAGAVANLTTPISKSEIEKNWELIQGNIPEAPGLADLDKLYPDLDKLEKQKLINSPKIPEMMAENPPIPPEIFPEFPLPQPINNKPKKRKWRIIVIILILSSSIFATLFGTGIIS